MDGRDLYNLQSLYDSKEPITEEQRKSLKVALEDLQLVRYNEALLNSKNRQYHDKLKEVVFLGDRVKEFLEYMENEYKTA